MLSLTLQCRKGNYKFRPLMAAVVALQEYSSIDLSERDSEFPNVKDQSNRSNGHNMLSSLAAKQIQLLTASQFKTMNKEVNSSNSVAPVETSIRQKLMKQFSPVHLEVLNESYMHNVPKGAETHFKVVVVSDIFANLPLIKRHRMVNEALQEELCGGVHALSIMAKTPEQWESNNEVSPSPACRGGFGK